MQVIKANDTGRTFPGWWLSHHTIYHGPCKNEKRERGDDKNFRKRFVIRGRLEEVVRYEMIRVKGARVRLLWSFGQALLEELTR